MYVKYLLALTSFSLILIALSSFLVMMESALLDTEETTLSLTMR